jgi:DNA invertase Pin-like site-specific DNA recombinase
VPYDALGRIPVPGVRCARAVRARLDSGARRRGLAAARKRGRIGGRPQAITGEKLDAIVAALDGGMSKAAVCRNFNVKRTTLIETLTRAGWRGAGRTVDEQQE